MRVKYFIALLFLLVFQSNLLAQSLSITEAVKVAQGSNLSIQSQKHAEKTVVETAKIAKRIYAPSVSLLGGTLI